MNDPMMDTADLSMGAEDPLMGQGDDRKPVIITFKKKDQRQDQSNDKADILRNAIKSDIDFASAEHASFDQVGSSMGIDINLYEAPILSASLTEEEAQQIRNNPNVEEVEEDGICYAMPELGPEPLVFEGQPSPLAETVPIGVSQVRAPQSWNSSRGAGIPVAIIDTGIDYNHPDLRPNVRGAISFVPGQSPMDVHGHGTHCAGTVAAAINGAGVVGVAPAASLYAVKVLSNTGSGNWSWLIAGIDWCIKRNIRVLSMSLGGASAPNALQTMCNTAFSKGLLLVAAAGNSGPNMNTVGFPGKYRSVIAVSAIDSGNSIANFSSRGPEVGLCAPGVNVLSCKPGGGYQNMSGTSMACPHVAGGAAVMWGAHRFARNVEIWNLMAASADNLGVPGWDPLYGYGRLDVYQASMALTRAPNMPLKP